MSVEILETAPTEEETLQALEASTRLAQHLNAPEPLHLRIITPEGKPATDLMLPYSAVRLLMTVLAQTAQGNAVTLIPAHAELTTQQAADFLNVSRPYLIGLLERREIPFRKVGSHRRVLFSELLAYQQQAEESQKRALDELAAQAQELKMGYE